MCVKFYLFISTLSQQSFIFSFVSSQLIVKFLWFLPKIDKKIKIPKITF